MNFLDALQTLKITVAKAAGGAVSMTPDQFVTYVGEQLRSAESEEGEGRTARLNALATQVAKVEEAAKAGATSFDIEVFKAATLATAALIETDDSLEKSLAALTEKVDALAKAVQVSETPAEPEKVAEVSKSDANTDAAAKTLVTDVKKSEDKPIEWPADLNSMK